MKLPGEEESGGSGISVFYMAVGVSAFVLILLVALFKSNDKKKSGSEYIREIQQQRQEEAAAEETSVVEEDGQASIRFPARYFAVPQPMP